ncbi:MAG TPA: hypothetical protein DDZ51_18700, partial [Planctomycetaceae bacterium]|nr:hypothetical protein [Planctomycetaceae bacterium]
LDAIVWIPTTYQAYEVPAIQWLHDWLGDRPRTLIYILPDEGNEVRYWDLAREKAPAEQRLEYRRRHARAISDAMNSSYGYSHASIEEIDRLWFKAKMRHLPRPRWQILPHQSVLSASGATTKGKPIYGASNLNTDWSSDGYELADEELSLEPLAIDLSGNALAVRIFTPESVEAEGSVTTVPSADGDADMDAEFDANWEDEDWMDEESWMDDAQWERLLRRRRGGYGIGESEVIVVASGSLISNFGIVTDEGRDLVKRLLVESGKRTDSTTPRVGFITSGYSGVSVSDSSGQPQLASGMELLTVWPLSIITIHLALMGIIVCLILLPIFGRPRKLKERTNSDFADHINAVGALLHRGNGEQYARQRISEYFRKVRGETSGPWVMPLPHIASAPPKTVAETEANASVNNEVTGNGPTAETTEIDSAKTIASKLDADKLETTAVDNHNLPQTNASLNQSTPEPRKDSNES